MKLVVERSISEVGFLVGRRGVGSIGWSIVQMRQEGSFYALSVISRQKNSALSFHKGRGCLAVGILWPRS